MALTESSLSTKIQTELISEFGAAADASTLKKFADAIARAVIEEFTTNAEVTSSGATESGTPGGPLTITDLDGDIS